MPIVLIAMARDAQKQRPDILWMKMVKSLHVMKQLVIAKSAIKTENLVLSVTISLTPTQSAKTDCRYLYASLTVIIIQIMILPLSNVKNALVTPTKTLSQLNNV